jgi:hypothetical protein
MIASNASKVKRQGNSVSNNLVSSFDTILSTAPSIENVRESRGRAEKNVLWVYGKYNPVQRAEMVNHELSEKTH